MKKPARILILGGGYVAISATRALRAAVRRGEAEVTVVSRENYHVFHGFVAEMVTGRISPGQILSPVRRIFQPARIHVGEIESIDLERRQVVTSRHLDGKHYTLEFDQLLLCLGSVDNFDAYPGLAEHAFRLKTYDDCFRLRNHILTMFELADIEADAAERRRLLTFFVAGGGFAGAEMAGELADYVRRLTQKDYPNIRREECRVVLVHPGPTILPELYGARGTEGDAAGHPRLVEYATRHQRKLGVELLTNTRVVWATPNEVGLSDGQRIPTRTIISAVGTRPAPLLGALPIPLDERGKVRTDALLQVPGFDYVWAAGDCASVPHPRGGTCPPVGIFALKQGAHVAANMARAHRGQSLKPFTFGGLGQGVSIGRRTAVAEMNGLEFKGFLSWLIWRLMLWFYIPTWDRRLRLLADWLIWPLVGRDTVEMSVADADDYEISHHVFQPGEVILAEGQTGHHVYLILEGEVETASQVLGPGSHFGHTTRHHKVQETVRARTAVQVVTVRSEQAHRLQRMLSSVNQVGLVSEPVSAE